MILRKPRYTDRTYYAIYHYEYGKTVINKCISSSFLINGLQISLSKYINTKLAALQRDNCVIKSKVYDDNFVQIQYTKPRGKTVAVMTCTIVAVDSTGRIICTDRAKEAGVLNWVWTTPKTQNAAEKGIES